jgi:tetratricopeptide (TPR) repeat protein
MTVFGQKDELKQADKAIDVNDFATAMTAINKAEGLIANADQKTKAKFYYLKAMALYQNGSNKADVEKVSAAFSELLKFEKETKVKYSDEIQVLTSKLVQSTAIEASNAYKTASQTQVDADYVVAADKFYMVYVLSPADTLYLDNAALIYNKGKAFEKSSELYIKLIDLDYTGISTIYVATNIEDGKEIVFNDKKSMDVQVKLGLVENPKTEVKESRRNIIYKYLSENYIALGELDKALEVIAKGREEYPQSYELLIAEANVYFKKDNKVKFKELLEEAIEINSEDPNLFYNVGVMSLDQGDIENAIYNFKKAIELNPDFAEAYQNIGTAIIEKTLPIVEEMNNSLSDFKKYDKLQAQQFDIYREALPYYEKAYELNGDSIGIVQTLLGLYENLEMNAKLTELKAVYDGLRE